MPKVTPGLTKDAIWTDEHGYKWNGEKPMWLDRNVECIEKGEIVHKDIWRFSFLKRRKKRRVKGKQVPPKGYWAFMLSGYFGKRPAKINPGKNKW
jgi:hypothetical protein